MSKNDDIKQDSNKIWLAGLGAYASIDENGSDAFERLVGKGREFEAKHQTQQTDVATDTRLNELKSRANQTMDRIEKAFDLRVSSALGRLGISRKSDLEALNEKIDNLALALDRICEEIGNKNKE